MKFSHIPPPNYKEIREYFPSADFKKGIVFTYGSVIYSEKHLASDVIIHEATHVKQQQASAKEWWKNYLTNPNFRLQQEVEAYHNQYKHNPAILHEIARHLSSSLYGNLCSYEEALKLIKNG